MISLVLCINLGVAVFPAAAAGTPVGLPQKARPPTAARFPRM